jgi:hypothetical protein
VRVNYLRLALTGATLWCFQSEALAAPIAQANDNESADSLSLAYTLPVFNARYALADWALGSANAETGRVHNPWIAAGLVIGTPVVAYILGGSLSRTTYVGFGLMAAAPFLSGAGQAYLGNWKRAAWTGIGVTGVTLLGVGLGYGTWLLAGSPRLSQPTPGAFFNNDFSDLTFAVLGGLIGASVSSGYAVWDAYTTAERQAALQ